MKIRYSGFLLVAFLVSLSFIPVSSSLAQAEINSGFLIDTQTIDDPPRPRRSELVDLDGDGDLDLFVPGSNNTAQRTYLNDGSGYFTAKHFFGGGWTMDAALADLDGDGDVDAFGANAVGQGDSVWFNNGDGSFTDSGQSLGATITRGVDLGDVDGDGDIDALTAVSEDDQSSVLWLNDGAGNFSDSGQVFSVSAQSFGVALADLDKDGDLDAFFANYGANLIFLNDGNGNFSNSGQSLGSLNSTYVALGDVDGDEDLDAFVANQSGAGNRVWLNNGSGVFTDSGQSLGSGNSEQVYLADMDRDTDLDAVVANEYDGNTVWINNGSGSFSSNTQDIDPGGRTLGLAVGDVDGDGDNDAVFANTDGDYPGVRLFLNKQSRDIAVTENSNSVVFVTQGEAVSYVVTVTGDPSKEASNVILTNELPTHVSDFNLETISTTGGATTTASTGAISGDSFSASMELPANSSITFTFSGEIDEVGDAIVSDTDNVFTKASVDISVNADYGDGFPANDSVYDSDIIIQAATAGGGIFVDAGQSLDPGPRPRRSVLADLDGDGDLDFFVANSNNASERIFINDGSGVFTNLLNFSGHWTMEAQLGDLDGDGDLDAFGANAVSQPNIIWLNNGAGEFSESSQTLGAAITRGLDLGDVDGDGDIDVLDAVSQSDASSTLWLNNGTGGFSDSGQVFSVSAQSFGVALGDLDGDGDLDAFFANYGANLVFFNDGTGEFSDSGQSLGSANSAYVDLGDLDGDGDLDAFVANTTGSGNTVWLNNGSGTFTNTGQSLGSGDSEQVRLGDADHDGDLDAFIANEDQANKLWLNNGSGGFSDSGQNFNPGSITKGVSIGDIDADGDIDAIFLSQDEDIAIWLNGGADTLVSLSGDNLLIEDDQGSVNNQYTLTSDGDNLTITEAAGEGGHYIEVDSGISGASGSGTLSVTIPFSSWSGKIIINAAGGNDTVTFAAGYSPNSAREILVFDDAGTDSVVWQATATTEIVDIASETINISGGSIETGGSLINLAASDGITIAGGLSTSGGAITLNADNDDDGSGSLVIQQSLSSGAGNQSLTAADISISAALSGSGSLSLSPSQADATVDLGFSTGSGDFVLDDSELGNLSNGFSGIVIGAADAGDISIDTASFADPVELRTAGATQDSTGTDISNSGGTSTINGEVTPGSSPGILSVDGDFAFADDSSFSVEIGGASPGTGDGNHDQVAVVNGTVTIGSSVTLSVNAWDSFVPTIGDTFVIIDNDGSDAIAGTFDNLAEGATLSNFLGTGRNAYITYAGGDGNDVVLEYIAPEIDVQRPAGAANSIASGSTDNLGTLKAGASHTFTYTVANTGSDVLTVSNIAASSLSSASINSISSTSFSVAAGGTSSFDVTFTPSSGDGSFSFDLTITNDDSDESSYLIHLSGTRDGTAPTVTVDIADSALSDGVNSSTVSFSFSEATDDFDSGDLTVVNGSISAFSGSGASYSATFTATDGVEGTGSVTVDVSSYSDPVGNAGASGSDTVSIDTANPTVTVNIVDSGLNDSDNSSSVTFEFSEAVSGFGADDLSANKGTLSGFSGSGDSYSATFTATDGISDAGDVSVADNSYSDLAGNLGSGGNDTVFIDTANPTVTVDIVDSALDDSDNSSSVTFSFSEPTSDFGAADLTVVNGVISGLTGSGDSYTATFTAADGVDGSGSVAVKDDSYSDASGNLGSGDSDSVTIDTVNPSVTVDILDSSLSDSDNSSSVTFEFSEATTDFDAGDLTVVNGAISGFSGSGTSYSATFTATDAVDGTGSVTVDAGSYSDPTGNLGASGSDSVAIDTENPTVIVNIVDSGLSDSDNSSNVTFAFSEEVSNFTVDDLVVSNGSISSFSGSGDSYSATFTATDGISGAGNVTVQNNSYTDLVGNLGAGDNDNVFIDTENPLAPGAPDLAAASDTGNSSSDDITDDTTPQFTGSCESGATVTLSSDQDGSLSPSETCAAGSYDITITTVLSENSHEITAAQSDPSGNGSPTSAALTIEVVIPTLEITVTGNFGNDNVDSTSGSPSPAAIDCGVGSDCTADFGLDESVNLEVTVDPGSSFSGWEGDCAALGTSLSDPIDMDGDKACTANFEAQPVIEIQRPAATALANGGTDDVGDYAPTTVTLLYTVNNSLGGAELSVEDVTASNLVNVSNFSLDSSTPLLVPAGGNDSFQITFDVDALGAFSFDLEVESNDSDLSPYVITIQGQGEAIPEIDVLGNDISIEDGDLTPSSADHTDFGNADINGAQISRTFTIENLGLADLELTGGPPIVSIGGSQAADFTLSTDASSPVSASNTSSFTILFDPSDTGLRQATISISNNDNNENPYTFAIQGTGTGPAPEMDVIGNGVSIPSGDSSPQVSDHTDFGSLQVDSGTVTYTYTIENSGSLGLDLNDSPAVSIEGANAGDFKLATDASTPVTGAGGTTTFSITFDPSKAGLRQATVSIANSDNDENPYTFAIQGTGLSQVSDNEESTDASRQGASAGRVFNVGSDGGVFSYLGVTVTIPAGSVSDGSQLHINPRSAGNQEADFILGEDWFDIFIIGPDGQAQGAFSPLLRVCVKPSAADLGNANGDINQLVLFHKHGSDPWQALGSSFVEDGSVCAPVSQLSLFVLGSGQVLPATGFAPDRVTALPVQDEALAYQQTGILLELPSLGIEIPVVGVPLTATGWDVSWLGGQAGYLESTAFPTTAGNSVITAHVYDAYGQPGPFVDLHSLPLGAEFYIHAFGNRYTYRVTDSRLATDFNSSLLASSSPYDQVTLLTCEGWDEAGQEYRFRRAIIAELVGVEGE